MIVYHGSDHVVREPVYLGGRNDNDYGSGFYTTEYKERAKEWAALNGIPVSSIVNKYELDLQDLRILNLQDSGVLAWIAEVVSHRGTEQDAAAILGDRIVDLYKEDTEFCDIITGYRADDSYTQVIEAFLLNQINVTEVERLFYKGDLGNQIFLKSEKAFRQIRWVASEEILPAEWYADNDLQARREVNRFLTNRRKAILLDGYVVPGITAQAAVQKKLIWNKESGCYE